MEEKRVKVNSSLKKKGTHTFNVIAILLPTLILRILKCGAKSSDEGNAAH